MMAVLVPECTMVDDAPENVRPVVVDRSRIVAELLGEKVNVPDPSVSVLVLAFADDIAPLPVAKVTLPEKVKVPFV